MDGRVCCGKLYYAVLEQELEDQIGQSGHSFGSRLVGAIDLESKLAEIFYVRANIGFIASHYGSL